MLAYWLNMMIAEGFSVESSELEQAIEDKRLFSFLQKKENGEIIPRILLTQDTELESILCEEFSSLFNSVVLEKYLLHENSNGYAVLLAFCIELTNTHSRFK